MRLSPDKSTRLALSGEALSPAVFCVCFDTAVSAALRSARSPTDFLEVSALSVGLSGLSVAFLVSSVRDCRLLLVELSSDLVARWVSDFSSAERALLPRSCDLPLLLSDFSAERALEDPSPRSLGVDFS